MRSTNDFVFDCFDFIIDSRYIAKEGNWMMSKYILYHYNKNGYVFEMSITYRTKLHKLGKAIPVATKIDTKVVVTGVGEEVVNVK